MSSKQGTAAQSSTKKKFGKGQREVPHHTQKAKKWYPAEDETQLKTVRKSIRPTTVRPSLTPGAILILLAGRFRGKRVVLLKHLQQGVLLVTGPFKVNGVPLRRVNARYVIATSAKVDLKGLDEKTIESVSADGYFSREKKKDGTKGEEEFFKQGEKPEKKLPSSTRAKDQKAVDKQLIANIKKEPHLISYLASSFSLRKGKLVKHLNHLAVCFSHPKKDVINIELHHGARKNVATLRTVRTIIQNLIIGVTRGFKYKMRYVYAHFPINVNLEKNNDTGLYEVDIRNFLGEKIVRRVTLQPGVEVEISKNTKDEIALSGNSLEGVSQSAADIQQICRVKNKDIRKFLDGLYVSERGNITEA
ncbi:MAG: 60S ribosomal protein L9 [Thelocarpon superellum]|nr:MAG: 60S ribosomal protein L9 [Thelocarpon superellum]